MMQNRGLLKYKVHHLFFWMLVFGAWYFLRFQDYRTPAIALRVTLVKVVDLAMMIYITNYLLLPLLFYKKKYVLFVLCLVGMIITSSIIKMNILGIVMDDPAYTRLNGGLKSRIYDNVIPHFFLVIAGAAIKLMFDYSALQTSMAEMAKEKAEAELSFLKSQINPHFLFNSLNSVYFLISKENAEARKALHTFSDMLRYQLYEMNGSKIPVEKELNYLRDYVELQKLRKDEHYSVEFTCQDTVKGFFIEPLLLIPFVENAFKHISHGHTQKNYVCIEMQVADGIFSFTVENSAGREATTEKHGGIGLANVKRRLELLYPGKHSLTIDQDDSRYRVKLTIKTDA